MQNFMWHSVADQEHDEALIFLERIKTEIFNMRKRQNELYYLI